MRQKIVEEIKRIHEKTGKPPGKGTFQNETGIKAHEWLGRFWANWGQALTEAGFSPNQRNSKSDLSLVFPRIAEVVLRLRRFPSNAELQIAWRETEGVPQIRSVLFLLRSKAKLVEEFRNWARQSDNAAELLMLVPERAFESGVGESETVADGFVYLLKSGPHYKIGRGDNLERRVKQITVALPESTVLVHAIRTDDPPGIEAYWHRRFSEKRANGEWFKLTTADVSAFKKRKFQ
jgi:hypothetical protein